MVVNSLTVRVPLTSDALPVDQPDTKEVAIPAHACHSQPAQTALWERF